MRRSMRIAVVGALLLHALVGCSPVPAEPAEEESTSEPAPVQVEPSEPVPADFTYLAGIWAVRSTLTEIDKGTMREAAEQPSQRWECQLDGSTMTLITDTHTYVGTIEPELDTGWVYTAEAAFADEDGAEWISRIEVHSKRTGDSSFAGSMERTIDSPQGEHLYTASWDIEGRRP